MHRHTHCFLIIAIQNNQLCEYYTIVWIISLSPLYTTNTKSNTNTFTHRMRGTHKFTINSKPGSIEVFFDGFTCFICPRTDWWRINSIHPLDFHTFHKKNSTSTSGFPFFLSFIRFNDRNPFECVFNGMGGSGEMSKFPNFTQILLWLMYFSFRVCHWNKLAVLSVYWLLYDWSIGRQAIMLIIVYPHFALTSSLIVPHSSSIWSVSKELVNSSPPKLIELSEEKWNDIAPYRTQVHVLPFENKLTMKS